MKSIHDLILEHPFFKAIPTKYLETIAGYGKNLHFKKGELIAKEGDDADFFYLLRSGLLSIEVHLPAKGSHVLQTLRPQEIAGWSWIYPPYQWSFDLKAIEAVSVIALDGKSLRKICESDHELGYYLMKEFAKIMTNRLKAARLQLLDIYGKDPHG